MNIDGPQYADEIKFRCEQHGAHNGPNCAGCLADAFRRGQEDGRVKALATIMALQRYDHRIGGACGDPDCNCNYSMMEPASNGNYFSVEDVLKAIAHPVGTQE